jgi:hypothetical protein
LRRKKGKEEMEYWRDDCVAALDAVAELQRQITNQDHLLNLAVIKLALEKAVKL